MTNAAPHLMRAAYEARAWLFDDLLPFWAEHGPDPLGGFHDQLDETGRPLATAKRCRVQARQVYVFAQAGQLGWSGPWRACMDHGLTFLADAFTRPDGLMRSKVGGRGAIVDDTADNYDQAFTLFALANAYAQTGDVMLVARAQAMLATLRAQRAHPMGGFHEDDPPTSRLRSNPHMHLFEAAIAWIEAADLPEFRALAAEIAVLAIDRFIEPASGALREYFDLNWRPLAGEAGLVAEPGHQFEWAWLLSRWHGLGGKGVLPAARRLYAFAEAHGVDHARGVAFNEIWTDGSPKDRTARLWPQTERLKAALALVELDGNGAGDTAVAAWRGLVRYRLPANAALFYDKLREDGSFIAEPHFASSLYHIVCAIAEFDRVVGQ